MTKPKLTEEEKALLTHVTWWWSARHGMLKGADLKIVKPAAGAK